MNNIQGLDNFSREFYQIYKEFTPILLKLLQKIEEKGTLPNSFYKATSNLIPNSDKDTTQRKKERKNYKLISLMIMDIEILTKCQEAKSNYT